MPEQTPTPLALALIYLRSAAAWTQTRLAQALGLSKESISQYERGTKSLTRERLDFLVAPLAPPEAVDVLLFAHALIFPEPRKEAPSPLALTPEERRRIHRAVMAAGWSAGRIASEALCADLIRRRKQEKTEAARLEARELWVRLKALTRQDRRDMVAAFPELWSWALAQRVSHESERMAAHKVEEALELADLALSIAKRIPGEESWRSRVEGYCWAHVGNARRVANNLAGADEAFARAWDLWRAGAECDPALLAEWRLFDLEASLRRDEQHFSESLKLLDQARAAGGNDSLAAGRILLKKEQTFHLMGDSRGALTALAEAAPFIEASRDARLLFAFRFKTSKHLCHLERYEEAAKVLPQVREMAVQQANELDLIRLVWLESKVAAGQGREEEAIAGLEQVGRDFTDRELPYDAALSSLDLSILWLKAGRTAEVRKLSVAMGWIFKAKKIDQEALAALKLFCDAARQESATVELAERVIGEIEQARCSAPRRLKERPR